MTTAFPSATTITTIILLIATISQHNKVTSLGFSSTISISYSSTSSATVCGIIAGEPTQRIQCYKDRQTIYIQPNISYDSISGGFNFFCGLSSGGVGLLCWETTTFRAKRIYYSYGDRLTDLTVGNSHICALKVNSGVTLCWRSFPSPDAAWKFRAITSGKGFSCGVLKNNNRVKCWGVSEIGDEIEAQIGDFTLSSLVAGESHVCGILKINGSLICRGSNVGGQLDVPSNSAFGFSNLAMGANHSCGIRRENGFVICWGGGSKRLDFVNPITRFESFESIVSGLDLVCGLSSKNLSILCWGPGWSSRLNSGNVVPLPMVIPGSCVQASCDKCGVYPNSDSLCSGSGSICKSCEPEVELPIPALVIPTMPPTPSLSHAKNRNFLAFGIVGSVGGFAGICTIVYLFWSGCGFLHKRIYNSVQTSAARGDAGALSRTNNSGSSGRFSRSASVKRESSWKFRRQRSGTSSNKHSDKAEKFSLSDLAVATSNFLLENKIGSGSFGIVYKGRLVDGREVAIKRGDNAFKMKKFQEKENAFASELLLLSRLHHKHLVELVGFCEEKDERLLVYEYMSNGSLHDHLHSKNNVEKGSSVLNSWKIRIKIALDAARGIEYLHNYAVPPIIHRDIKSSNILLDANWTSKVSDFGLSLMGPESDQDSMSIRAVGTVGYIDPESYVLNILTAKSDVYGLGVVVLEILTGKRAVFKEEGSAPMSVVEYSVPNITAGQLRSILDKRVGFIEMNEAEAVELVALTALRCVNLEGVERPTVTEIVANLERALAHCEESRDSISSSTFSIFSQ